MIDLSHLGFIKVSGQQAKTMLQGQLTCHMDEITPSQTRLAAHCNPQGRIISLFRIFFYREDYYLQMPIPLIPLAIKALQKYAVFFNVTIEDASHTLMKLGYTGTDLHLMRQTLPSDVDSAVETNQLMTIKVSDHPSRFEIIGDGEALHQLTNEHMAFQQHSVWQSMEIESGNAAIYPETSEKFLPHDIQLPQRNGVSFQKGCFTGQEIIARMHYRGKPKNQMYHMSSATPHQPVRGADIFSTNGVAGSIIDYCQDDKKNHTLLVLTHDITQSFYLDAEKKHPLHAKKV